MRVPNGPVVFNGTPRVVTPVKMASNVSRDSGTPEAAETAEAARMLASEKREEKRRISCVCLYELYAPPTLASPLIPNRRVQSAGKPYEEHRDAEL